MATLAEVLDFYDRGGQPNPWLDEKMGPLGLTDQEKEDLLAFLESLTGEVPEWAGRAAPPAACGERGIAGHSAPLEDSVEAFVDETVVLSGN